MPVVRSDSKCRCGRPLIPPHCTHCGSTNLYGRAKNGGPYIDENGEAKMSKGFHCRKCEEDFNDQTPCTLPYWESKGAVTRQEKEDRTNRIKAAAEAAVTQAKAAGVTDKSELNKIAIRKTFELQGMGALVNALTAPTEPVPVDAPRASDEDNYVDTWPPREDK